MIRRHYNDSGTRHFQLLHSVHSIILKILIQTTTAGTAKSKRDSDILKIQIVTEKGIFMTFCKENGFFGRGVFFAFCRIFLYFWRGIPLFRAK
jgi:hypothetical protein